MAKKGGRQPPHHAVAGVSGSEPRGAQQLRPGVRLARVVLQVCCGSGLHREIPIRDGQLGVHELQAELEGVGDERVAHQEAESVVELGGREGCHGSFRKRGGNRI